MRKNFILLFVALTLAIGCSALDSLKTKNYSPPVFIPWQEYLDMFTGKPISAAQKVYGYKYDVKELEEGGKAYTWERVKTIHTSNSSTKKAIGLPDTYYQSGITTSATRSCRWTFITNSKNVIVGNNYLASDRRGRACPKIIRKDLIQIP